MLDTIKLAVPLRIAALTVVALLVSACDGGRSVPPKTSVRVVHAAPTVAPVVFRRVQANATNLDYKGSATFSFDVDTYTFNFEITAPDGSVTETVSFQATLADGVSSTIVLRELNGQPSPRVVEAPASGSGTGTNLQMLHSATSLIPLAGVDVFIELQDFDLTTATPWGTIAYDEVLPQRELTNGTYEIAVTEAGVRTNVLLRTEPFALTNAPDLTLVLIDGADEGLAPVSIMIADGGNTELVDRDLESGIRVLNAVNDRSAIDAGIDNELSPPIITNVAFATASPFALIPAGDHDLNVTPAMNPGVIETDAAFTAARGTLSTWLVTGNPGDLEATPLTENLRVIAGESRLSLFNGGLLNANVEIFIAAPGANLADLSPLARLPAQTGAVAQRIAPGDYELTVRDPSTLAMLAGPQALTIGTDGYYGILLNDAAGGSTVDVSLLFDFN